jgi:acyl carrier protein
MDKKFKIIVESVLKKKFSLNMNMENTPQWDSLNFINLISRLEKNYKKKLRDSDLEKCTYIKKIYEILTKKNN